MFAKVHNIISKLSTMIGEYSNIIPSCPTKTFWRHRQLRSLGGQLSNHDRQLPWYCRQLSITRRQLRSDVDNLGTMVVLWKLPIMVSKKNSDHGLDSPWRFIKAKGEYTPRMRVGGTRTRAGGQVSALAHHWAKPRFSLSWFLVCIRHRKILQDNLG